jgi:ATP-binding cassette subfamily E protein 1
VLDRERCKPKDCLLVCRRFCPMVRSRKEAIKIEQGEEKPTIVETLCSGCGICIKKCPFEAIHIVNLPDELEGECSHRFGKNAFKLFRLPMPRRGVVTGLIGQNGIGKSTALRILAGEIKPNLGDFESPADWDEISRYYRGSILQEYFLRLGADRLKVVHKPQYVDKLPEAVSGAVGDLLRKVDSRNELREVSESLQITGMMDREIGVLSGGDLQRVAIAATVCREADVYLFDEPSSYLDVKQRINAARTIRTLALDGKTVVVAEHDLAVLDYLSDQVHIFYGDPGVYGIVSKVHGVREGINIYLDGYLPDENVRFRDEPVRFHAKPPSQGWSSDQLLLRWGSLKKSYKGFTLDVKAGEVWKGEVIGVLGPNGIGKTTFIKLIAGIETPDKGSSPAEQGIQVSYKPQYITPEYEGTVESLLRSIVGEGFSSTWYVSEIVKPLNIGRLLNSEVQELSGGELQRVAIASCLSRRASLYLLDEPSAYLDVEERLSMVKAVRRITENRASATFVAEHDVVAQDFLADRLMVFTGEPGVRGSAGEVTSLRDGMNSFLREMETTFRRDPTTRRPRVNKPGSRMDLYQKEKGEYYYLGVMEEET